MPSRNDLLTRKQLASCPQAKNSRYASRFRLVGEVSKMDQAHVIKVNDAGSDLCSELRTPPAHLTRA